MSASALVSGRLQRDPERKMSKAGKPFVSATIRDGEGEAVNWWNVLSFSETANEELLSLKAGDSVAVTGQFKAEVYEKGDTRRVSFTLFVDRLITAKKQKRERPALQAQSEMPPFDDGSSF